MAKFTLQRKTYPKKEKVNKMTISKNGKNYTFSAECKTVEEDLITISMGYKAKEILNKSEVAKLITLLTEIISD